MVEEVPRGGGVLVEGLLVVGVDIGVDGVLWLVLHNVEGVDGVEGFVVGDGVVVAGIGDEGVVVEIARGGVGVRAVEEGDGDARQQKETRNDDHDDAQEHAVTGVTTGSEISQHFLSLENREIFNGNAK